LFAGRLVAEGSKTKLLRDLHVSRAEMLEEI
jgi:hypothetical protein